MYHLLTIMEMSDNNLDDDHLHAELKLMNPSQSHITSVQLYNFWLWAKRERGGNSPMQRKKSKMLNMFCKQGPSKPVVNDALCSSDELYQSGLIDAVQCSNNSW